MVNKLNSTIFEIIELLINSTLEEKCYFNYFHNC